MCQEEEVESSKNSAIISTKSKKRQYSEMRQRDDGKKNLQLTKTVQKWPVGTRTQGDRVL